MNKIVVVGGGFSGLVSAISAKKDNNEVSKNAVHKTLNTIVNKLEYYEEKLRLYDKSLKIRDLVSDLDEVTKEKIYDLI